MGFYQSARKRLRWFFKFIYRINIVGADMVEVLPDKDFSNITCIAAATLAQDLMYLLNENRRNNKK